MARPGPYPHLQHHQSLQGPEEYSAGNCARKVWKTNTVQVSHGTSMRGLPSMVGSGKATHWPSASTQARLCTLQYLKLNVGSCTCSLRLMATGLSGGTSIARPRP